MKIHKARDINDALTKKGFQREVSQSHFRYIFVYQNKITQIHTKLSMGSHGDPARDNLHKMKRDLHFDNYEDFSHLIECSFSQEQFIDMLKQKNLL